MARSRAPGGSRDDAGLIGATILAIGAGLLCWAFFVSPYPYDPSPSAPGVVVTVAYPLADATLLGMLARLLFGGVVAMLVPEVEMGCDHARGYHFVRPLAAEEIRKRPDAYPSRSGRRRGPDPFTSIPPKAASREA